MSYVLDTIMIIVTFIAGAVCTFMIDDPRKLLNFNYGFLLSIILCVNSILFLQIKREINKKFKSHHDNIEDIKRVMSNVSSILEKHMPDQAELFKYLSTGAWQHNKISDALEYDIKRIKKLGKNQYFYSTYINDKVKMQKDNNDPLFCEYIEAIREACNRGVAVKRIIIKDINFDFDDASRNHFDLLRNSGVELKVIAHSSLQSDLAENFVVISDDEVGFAYPLRGNFQCALNYKVGENRGENWHEKYKIYFERLLKAARSY